MKIKHGLFTIALALIMAIAFMTVNQNGAAYAATSIGSGGSSYDNAPQLSLGKQYSGTAEYGYYKFKTSKNKNVSYQFRGTNYGKSSAIFVELYDYDGNKITKYTWLADGKPDTRMTLNYLKTNTTYYLKMNKSILYSEKPSFSIKISQVASKPEKATINYIKAGKNYLTVKWRSVPYANKYQVQYRRVGTSQWKSKMTTSRKMTIKGLKMGKKYQIRVRAIRIVDGKKYNGEYSSKVRKKVK